MEKIVEKIVDGLMKQREKLVEELTMLNQNEPSFEMKRGAIDKAIIDIDVAVSGYIATLDSKS